MAEKSIDSQKAVDNKIKEKCEEFIDYTYQYITMELRELLSPSKQPETEPAAVPQSAVDGGNSSSVSEENYKQRVKEAIEAYRGKKEAIEKSMSLYLSNQETEAIIFRQIKVSVSGLWIWLLTNMLFNYYLEQSAIFEPTNCQGIGHKVTKRGWSKIVGTAVMNVLIFLHYLGLVDILNKIHE